MEQEYITRLRESLETSEVQQLIAKFEYAFSTIEINLRLLVFTTIVIMIFTFIALIKVYR